MRGEDSAARMGGDEFIFIFKEIGDSDDIKSIGARPLSAFEEPYAVNGCDIQVSAGVGGAVYPEGGVDAVTLVQKADIAMYEAKNAGGNRFRRIGGRARNPGATTESRA